MIRKEEGSTRKRRTTDSGRTRAISGGDRGQRSGMESRTRAIVGHSSMHTSTNGMEGTTKET
eukprot:3741019-Heterocapsa_arctica.AAC.1